MPCLEGIAARRDFIDLEVSGSVGNRVIRVRHDADVGVHPVVKVTLYMQHDLFILRLPVVNNTGDGLTYIEAVVLAGKAVNIMQE